MELIKVEENALTLELSWADCTLLAHLCRRALEADALGSVPVYAMTDGYARALVALFEVSGMASWAYTVRRDRFTIEHFRQVAPVTTQDWSEPTPADQCPHCTGVGRW